MVRHAFVLAAVALSLLLAGCTQPPEPTPSPSGLPTVTPSPTVWPSILPPYPTPSPEPSPTPTASATPSPGSLASLRYAVLTGVGGDIQFCDRDYYPVGSSEREMQNAKTYVANPPDRVEFDRVLQHLAMSGTVVFSDEQSLVVYREYKRINAVIMTPQSYGYTFSFLVQYPNPSGPSPGRYGENLFLVKGTVTSSGLVTITSKEPGMLVCPICLAAGTMIDAPKGLVLVQDLRVGDSVFTQDEYGRKVVQPVLKTASVPAQAGQPIVHLVLQDGRDVWLSGGHPLADGRLVADLKAGDTVDGSNVALIESAGYEGAATYDLLPAGPTGAYWANRILMGSTLK